MAGPRRGGPGDWMQRRLTPYLRVETDQGDTMPTRDTAPVGAPIWIDLMASDVARSRAFYCSLFGWETEAPHEDLGGYLNFTREGVPVAGCVGARPGSARPTSGRSTWPAPTPPPTVTAVAIHGGHPLVGATPSPTGQSWRWRRPGPACWLFGSRGLRWLRRAWRGRGSGLVRVVHPGLRRRGRVLPQPVGWDTHVASDTEDLRYTTLGTDDSALAGVMDASGFLPEGARGQWSIYFGVDDADKALALIVDSAVPSSRRPRTPRLGAWPRLPIRPVPGLR